MSLLGFCIYYIWYWEYRPHGLEAYFFTEDGGVGSPPVSTFFRTSTGKTILVDGGKTSQIVRKISSVMPFYRKDIDVIVITNPDDAHVTGLVDVVKRYHVKKIIEPYGVVSTSSSYLELKRVSSEKGLQLEEVKTGDMFNMSMIAKVFFPDQSFQFSKTNPPRLVFSLGDASSSTSFLFAADISKSEQKYIAGKFSLTDFFASNIAATNRILVFPHAANAGALRDDFLTLIKPTTIIYSRKSKVKKGGEGLFATSSASAVNLADFGDTAFSFNGNYLIKSSL
jgi:beta-lactamase superfamily II metal-dependent hydrolase